MDHDTYESMGAIARHYNQLGWHVLLPDQRGHGRSEGDYVGWGYEAQGGLAQHGEQQPRRKAGAGRQDVVVMGQHMAGIISQSRRAREALIKCARGALRIFCARILLQFLEIKLFLRNCAAFWRESSRKSLLSI